MKYIKKGNEPEQFLEWKNKKSENWKPQYINIDSDVKQTLHQELIKEQGYICCYCGKRVSENDSHIEHFRPQKKYPSKELDYQNLHASCQGLSKNGEDESDKKVPRHCGHLKGNWFDKKLLISPLSKNCETRFKFIGHGQIEGNDQAAKETIKKLGLDIDKLRALRREAIHAAIPDAKASFNPPAIRKMIARYEKKDNNGQYAPFCTAIVYVLKKFLLKQ